VDLGAARGRRAGGPHVDPLATVARRAQHYRPELLPPRQTERSRWRSRGPLRPVLPFLPRGVRRRGQPGGASLPSPTVEEQGLAAKGWGRGETGRQGTQRWGTEGDRDRDLRVGPTCQDGRKIRAETVLALILGRDI
jgi:hypothetical protein